jgi:hypothetical protein
VHRSTYYAWKRQVDRHGLEMLRPKERRRPQMPNELPKIIEERIVSFSIAHPGLGPRRVASDRADLSGRLILLAKSERLHPVASLRPLRTAGERTRRCSARSRKARKTSHACRPCGMARLPPIGAWSS